MGFLSDLFDSAKGAVIGGVGGAVGTAAGQVAGKVLGIPSPGQAANDYFSQAFPGTNPWERLGSPAAGAGVQRANVKDQVSAQREQTRAQERVGTMNAKASAIASAVQFGPEAVDNALSALRGGELGTWDTPLSVLLAKAPSEIFKNYYQAKAFEAQARAISAKLRPELAKLDADTKAVLASGVKLLAEGKIAQAEAQLADGLAKAKLISKEFGALAPLIQTGQKGLDMFNSSAVSDFIDNTTADEFVSVLLGVLAARFGVGKLGKHLGRKPMTKEQKDLLGDLEFNRKYVKPDARHSDKAVIDAWKQRQEQQGIWRR